MCEIEAHITRARETHLRLSPSSRPLFVLNSQTNTGRTQDGILCLGRRMLEEIQQFLALQEAQLPPAPSASSPSSPSSPSSSPTFSEIHISFVGHSLGGLIARSCVGWLLHRRLLPSPFRPVSLVTVASPHLGARRAARHHALLKELLRFYWLGPTLPELFLEDHLRAPLAVRALGPQPHAEDALLLSSLRRGRPLPLLFLMAERDSIFHRGLRAFSSLTLVSPLAYDWQVPYCSSSLAPTNPHCLPPSTPLTNRIALMHGFDAALTRRVLALAHPRMHPTLLRAPLPDGPPPQGLPDGFCFEDLRCSTDFALHDGLYHPAMLHSLQQLPWRRLDIAFDKLFSHDLLVAKPSVPAYDCSLGVVSSCIIGEMVVYDHQRASSPMAKL